MRNRLMWHECRRRLGAVLVVASGVLAVVGSGGGLGTWDGFSYQGGGGGTPSAFVSLTPSQPTVQAGSIVEFSVYFIMADPPVAYQWSRNGVNIAGATGPTYTLGGATLADDGAVFHLQVRAANGTATGSATLRVSPLPGVVFEDADFATANWSEAATAQPAANGPTATIARAVDGGTPGPYRSIAYQMTPAPSSMRLVQTHAGAVYDPRTQGEIYTIDFILDCARITAASPMANETPTATPVLQQGGRTYVPLAWSATCTTWQGRRRQSLLPQDFDLLAGSPCPASTPCRPDYSSAAPALLFGFVTELAVSGSTGGGALTQGVDNWKVTVWRK